MRVASKKCSFEEVTALQREVDRWLTEVTSADAVRVPSSSSSSSLTPLHPQSTALYMSSLLLKAILANHVAFSDAFKAAKNAETSQAQRHFKWYSPPEALRSSFPRSSWDKDSSVPQWRAVWVRRGREGVLRVDCRATRSPPHDELLTYPRWLTSPTTADSEMPEEESTAEKEVSWHIRGLNIKIKNIRCEQRTSASPKQIFVTFLRPQILVWYGTASHK